MLISFIIPALNEESNIGQTLTSINSFEKQSDKHSTEVIVIDNGSTDDTVNIAERLGAKVMIEPEATIAGLRNHGASIAKGDVFIFLDSDVLLTPQWNENIDQVLEKVHESLDIITGSHTVPPESNNWLLKYWFSSFAAETESEHVGSAHMIMSKNLFEKLNGFNGKLVTAEDYDICYRAKKENVKIINDRNLKVIHEDYPLTVSNFIKREIWHGLGDCASISYALKSKSLIASVVFFSLILSIFGFGYFDNYLLSSISLLSLCGLLLLSSWVKYKHSGYKFVLINAIIFIFYYTGRLLSLVKCALK
ncbi:glycosyltransferase [Pseudomonadota bacterium]